MVKKSCQACGREKEKEDFSQDQWDQTNDNERMCKACQPEDMEGNSNSDNDDDRVQKIMRDIQLNATRGGTFFVSRKLRDQVTVGADGVHTLDLSGGADEQQQQQEEEPKRGQCANPNCTSSSTTTATTQHIQLKRCARCWNVDYCCRDCQKQDWPRHKRTECQPCSKPTSTSTDTMANKKTEDLSWQALAYSGKVAMQKRNYDQAISCWQQAIDKEPTETCTFLVDLAHCYLNNGDYTSALKYAYQACQADYMNPHTLVMKAKCHQALGQIEAAWLAVYSCQHSHVLKAMTAQGNHQIEQHHVLTLYRELMQCWIDQIMTARRPISLADFPLVRRAASVPFTISTGAVGTQVAIIQNLTGTGWHSCHASQEEEAFSKLQCHTAVPYGSSLILFGGSNPAGATNVVRVFQLDHDNSSKYSLQVKHCSGELPPPVEGHAACIVDSNMYVFGGCCHDDEHTDVPLADLYVLDLDNWHWSKVASLSNTPSVSDRPDNTVCFASLTPLDDDSILLIGGRRLRNHAREGPIGFHIWNDTFLSDNMHVYSCKTQQWKRMNARGSVPRLWGHSAHNVGPGKVVLFGGQCKANSLNTIYLVELQDDVLEWTKVEECMDGIPPPLSMYRATTWMPSTKRLFTFGGRSMHYRMSDSVLKMGNDTIDVSAPTIYFDTELYSFDLFGTKQWTRLRLPDGCMERSGHTLTELNGHLIFLGGTFIPPPADGGRLNLEAREYVTDVLRFDLEFPADEPPRATNAPKKTRKKKGKRKGGKR